MEPKSALCLGLGQTHTCYHSWLMYKISAGHRISQTLAYIANQILLVMLLITDMLHLELRYSQLARKRDLIPLSHKPSNRQVVVTRKKSRERVPTIGHAT